MKYLFATILLMAGSAEAQAFDCPKSPENYRQEIADLRMQQKALSDQLNQTSDTGTADSHCQSEYPS